MTYTIVVSNPGTVAGTYGLKDTPLFDNDVTINSGSYSGQASGSMNISGTTTLATNAAIAAGATHTYNVTFNVSLNLAPGSADGGDNIYTRCSVPGNGPGSSPNQGLFNRAELDVNGDGNADITDDACGDLPNLTMRKDFVSATVKPDGTYDVTYNIFVTNTGGATGTYTLKDTHAFDDDVTVNGGSYNGGLICCGTFFNTFTGDPGTLTLISNTSLGAGLTDVFSITYNVSLNLALGSPDGGDNIYTACAVPGNGPGSGPGQGLYNRALLDTDNDVDTDITDDSCGDLPDITMRKDFGSAGPNGNGTYNVTYTDYRQQQRRCIGCIHFERYAFIRQRCNDQQRYLQRPGRRFNEYQRHDHFGNKRSHRSGCNAHLLHYLQREPEFGSGIPGGGDNTYTPCQVPGNGPGSGPNQGLYNRAELDTDNDGDTDITDDACGDLPNINMVKNFVSAVPNGNGTFNVTYTIVVSNHTPMFDNDVTINSGSFSGQASGAMNISGTTTLATNAAIAAGASHMYTVTFNVS
ncbi:MAG: hypothetical protein IPL27_07740 [Lewinellaceae bacterium]|nr:hypothetical protein [Lewinellaceae bacterium]